MMLPILISVSVAPVSYFFWASAPPEAAANAMTAVENAAILSSCLENILSPQFYHLGLQDGLSACETPRTASVRFVMDIAEFLTGRAFARSVGSPLRSRIVFLEIAGQLLGDDGD